jgi:polar amino acid transport system substrate-binding protein
MKRFWVAAVAVALAAAAFAAWGLAAPAGLQSSSAPLGSSATVKPKLPKLPAAVKSRKKWQIGIKCDFPPFGYIDVRGRNAGYDVEVARRFAQLAFGKKSKVELVCVTTPSRIPTLQSGRVDIIISTLTWTAARAEVIDYSIPYYSATGRLLVPNNSSIHSLADLKGKTIVTTRGALYATWTRNCFKDTDLLEVDSPSAATLAVKNGQAATFMFDDAFLLGVATQDPTLKLTKDKFLNIPWGIGIRKGDTVTARWVNAAIRYMKKRNEFVKILRNNAPARLVPSFIGNVPRPKSNFRYPVGKDTLNDCSSK